MEFFITLVVVTFSLALLLDYLVKKRRNDMTANFPGPKPLPFLGNALMYMGKSPEDILYHIIKNRKKYGSFYRVWIFNQLAVFSCDPKDVEIILGSTKHITKNNLYVLLNSWLGDGLLLSTESKWHSRRKIITPTFHFKILEEFIEIFDQQSNILVGKLKSVANEEAFNVHPYITLALLDIIAETAMGVKVHAQSDTKSEYAQAVSEVTNILANRFVNVWHRSEWIFQLTAPGSKRRQDKAVKTLHDFTEKIIEERRKTLQENQKNGTAELETDDLGRKKKLALLDVLLQATTDGKPLSNNDIREEVDTFMFEGHDTTTSAVCFALQLISRHARVQEKLFAEIRDVIGDDKTKPITLRELQDLKYMEYAIKEALRLYPSVPIIGRMFTEDVNMNGKIVPKGTNYTVGIYVMLRDPILYPDPDKYDPDRHLPENSNEKTNPYSYIPFSAGPRNCIGQKFAMLELKSTISKILRYYELLPLGPDARPMLNLVMRSANGFHLGLRPRVY